MTSPIGGCTMNFVFKDASNALYIGTAAHCVTGVGGYANDTYGQRIGTVVFWEYHTPHADDDHALIKIDANRYGDVNPMMRVFGGPTGYTTWTETVLGDRVLNHGYGLGYSSVATTRSRRGILYADNKYSYSAEGMAIFGDSGGPILHAKTGKALGFTNTISVAPWLVNGTTTERFLERLSARGINVSLVTADYYPWLIT